MDILVKYGTFCSGSLPRTGTGLLALLLFGFGARLAGQQAPCLNRTLAVTVTTQDYQPVKDLTAANFSAKLGHEPIKIVSVGLATGARIVIVMDTSGSMVFDDRSKWKTAIAAAEGLFSSAPPGTTFGLLTFAGQVEDRVDFRQGAKAVVEELRKLLDTDWERKTRQMRWTALTDAINEALELLGTPGLGDAIYLVSDGGENASKVKGSRGYARVLSTGLRLFAFMPVGSLIQRGMAPEEFAGPETVGRLAEETGGSIVVYSRGGTVGAPYGWPSNRTILSSARAALQAARTMDQEVTEFYRLELELPKPLGKSKEWRLEATKLMGEKNVHLRVNYPHKLQPCQ